MSASSPNCCTPSKKARTVTLFVPAGDWRRAHWSIPFRDDDGNVVKNGTTSCRFCPFCGVRLTRDHLAFETDEYMTDESREERDAALSRASEAPSPDSLSGNDPKERR